MLEKSEDSAFRSKPRQIGADQARLGLFAAAITVVWVAIGAFVYNTNQEENALTVPWQAAIKPSVQAVLPEQWGFFTKSPRDETIEALLFNADSQWVDPAIFPHSQAQYTFGWNRISRAHGIEIGAVYSAVTSDAWINCAGGTPLLDCLEKITAAEGAIWEEVVNSALVPQLCGRAAIALIEAAPWAWAQIGQAQGKASVILMDVQC